MRMCPTCGSVYVRDISFCGLDGQPLVEQTQDPMIGNTIDRYRIVRLLGAGGTARVYEATHLFIEKACALKILYGDLASDKAIAKRFHREAQAISEMQHENIVRVEDFGQTPEGVLFMALELLKGQSLAEMLHTEGAFSPYRAAQVTRQIAAGLGAAHAKGFIHRDLKPMNVMMADDGKNDIAKILDFGLVRLLEQPMEQSQLTARGQLFGTPSYMSPEQVSGREVDARSDLYSLGVVLYELLTSSPPFTGDLNTITAQKLAEMPKRPADEHSGLTNLVMELLARDPLERPQTAQEVIRRIDELNIEPTKRTDGTFRAPPRAVSDPDKWSFDNAEPEPLAIPLATDRDPLSSGPALHDSRPSARHPNGTQASKTPWLVAAGILILLVPAIIYTGFRAPTSIKVVELDVPPEIEQTAPPTPQKTPRTIEPTAAKDSGPPQTTIPAKTKEPPKETPSLSPQKDNEPSAPKEDAPQDPPPSLETMSQDIHARLKEKGLSWTDLLEADSQPARQWRSYKPKSPPPADRLQESYVTLIEAIDNIDVNRDFLVAKLARVQKALNRSASKHKTTTELKRRHREIDARLGASSSQGLEPKSLAQEITKLEKEATKHALSAPRKRRPSGPSRRKKSDGPDPLDSALERLTKQTEAKSSTIAGQQTP